MDNDIIWIDVVGYEGLYEVSNNGQVRTKEGKTTYTERFKEGRVWKQRILKQKVDKENSCRVSLWKDGKEKTHLVHRLIATAFIPNPENKGFVNHKDGSRLNNNLDNLEWNSFTENQNHAFDNDLTSTNHKIKLIHTETNQEYLFRSKAKASRFLNRNIGFIHHRLKSGHKDADGYRIIELKKHIKYYK